MAKALRNRHYDAGRHVSFVLRRLPTDFLIRYSSIGASITRLVVVIEIDNGGYGGQTDPDCKFPMLEPPLPLQTSKCSPSHCLHRPLLEHGRRRPRPRRRLPPNPPLPLWPQSYEIRNLHAPERHRTEHAALSPLERLAGRSWYAVL